MLLLRSVIICLPAYQQLTMLRSKIHFYKCTLLTRCLGEHCVHIHSQISLIVVANRFDAVLLRVLCHAGACQDEKLALPSFAIASPAFLHAMDCFSVSFNTAVMLYTTGLMTQCSATFQTTQLPPPTWSDLHKCKPIFLHCPCCARKQIHLNCQYSFSIIDGYPRSEAAHQHDSCQRCNRGLAVCKYLTVRRCKTGWFVTASHRHCATVVSFALFL